MAGAAITMAELTLQMTPAAQQQSIAYASAYSGHDLLRSGGVAFRDLRTALLWSFI